MNIVPTAILGYDRKYIGILQCGQGGLKDGGNCIINTHCSAVVIIWTWPYRYTASGLA